MTDASVQKFHLQTDKAVKTVSLIGSWSYGEIAALAPVGDRGHWATEITFTKHQRGRRYFYSVSALRHLATTSHLSIVYHRWTHPEL